ncbi:hypothetical protein [Ruegeria sp. HKCCD8929]|uniref:hypothetical protein n=1 Tax=Ruegeria sp. HKCCD8929 TaxID=2683006 RepID=UPI001489DCA3|nr:hypothetical protein [Ruegeria sp. HKCCD8929]
MTSNLMHPSELAYAFSFTRAERIIGWDQDYFLPEDNAATDTAHWLAEGESRLHEADRLIGSPEAGLNFTDEMSSAVLALVDPSLVLLAERKEGEGVRRLSVHAAGADFIGLTRRPDGLFDLTRYADLTAAAGACAGFLGAALVPLSHQVRIEASYETFADLRQSAASGETDKVVTALTALGASKPDAKSFAEALAQPASAGMLSVFYCANNEVQDAEPFTVMTNDDDQTWVLFPPASLDAPMILERSSVAAFTARVAVGVAARLSKPG